MSKTDKTKPWWAQVTKWVPSHYCISMGKPCDLPANPPRNAMEANWRTRINQCCEWQPANWNEIAWAKESEWYLATERNRSRAKRQWRKDWGVA